MDNKALAQGPAWSQTFRCMRGLGVPNRLFCCGLQRPQCQYSSGSRQVARVARACRQKSVGYPFTALNAMARRDLNAIVEHT
jgi:hypothetical protein